MGACHKPILVAKADISSDNLVWTLGIARVYVEKQHRSLPARPQQLQSL
jgi:hypothetical protein